MKIALIDDNRTVAKTTEIMLKKEKYIGEDDLFDVFLEISSLSDSDYLEFANKYDLIICDYNLGANSPNGLDFLRTINEINHNANLLLLTGDDSIVMRTKMALISNIKYIVKSNDKENGTIAQLGNIINTIKKTNR